MRDLRVAMWSGALTEALCMMRAWGNRRDTVVLDDPFYPNYLARRRPGLPGTIEVLARHPADTSKIVETITAPAPPSKPLLYMKLTTRYLPPGLDSSWLGRVTSCFLIRDPRELLALQIRQRVEPTVERTGLPLQAEIFRQVSNATGRIPPVIDAADLQRDPRRVLGLLCDALDVAFDDAMLSWAPGLRDSDGAWAPRNYRSVEQLTGFEPHRPIPETLASDYMKIYLECIEHQKVLYRHRLGAAV